MVNYNTGELVAENFHKNFSSVQREGFNLHLFLVDNLSTDNSFTVLTNAIREQGLENCVTLIQAECNGGFAYGNNLGLAEALSGNFSPDYFYLLNPDAYLLPGAIEALVDFSKKSSDECILGSILHDEQLTPRTSAFSFPTLVTEFRRGMPLQILERIFPRPNFDLASGPLKVDWVSGACFFFSRKVFERLGWMDQSYFLYFEEVDYMRQARQVGVPVYSVPTSGVVHVAGASTKVVGSSRKGGAMPDYWYESWHRYFNKNHSRMYACFTGLAWLSGRALNKLLAVIRPARKVNDGHSMARFFRKGILGVRN